MAKDNETGEKLFIYLVIIGAIVLFMQALFQLFVGLFFLSIVVLIFALYTKDETLTKYSLYSLGIILAGLVVTYLIGYKFGGTSFGQTSQIAFNSWFNMTKEIIPFLK